jgi:hypothetical protein
MTRIARIRKANRTADDTDYSDGKGKLNRADDADYSDGKDNS